MASKDAQIPDMPRTCLAPTASYFYNLAAVLGFAQRLTTLLFAIRNLTVWLGKQGR